MKENLITLETAKLAKEKGFDIYCECSYLEGNITYMTPGGADSDGIHTEYTNYLKYPRHLAPTQSLLQRWLREEYKLLLYVKPYWEEDYTFGGYCCWLVNGGVEDFESEEAEYYFNYEESLERGLYEALKSIRI